MVLNLLVFADPDNFFFGRRQSIAVFPFSAIEKPIERPIKIVLSNEHEW